MQTNEQFIKSICIFKFLSLKEKRIKDILLTRLQVIGRVEVAHNLDGFFC